MENGREEQSADARPRAEGESVGRRKSGRPDRIPYAIMAEAKRLYLYTSVPVSEICALLGIRPHALYYRIHKWKWPMRGKLIPEEEPVECAAVGGDAGLALAEDSASRIAPPTGAERRALLARAHRIVEAGAAALERMVEENEKQTASEDDPDDEAFRNMEELGRAISAHLDAIELEEADELQGGTED